MKKEIKTENWEKEFDEWWWQQIRNYKTDKSFIRHLLQKERQKIIDEILKELPKERIYEKEIKELKIDNSSIEGEFHEKFLEGFNQALQEIKEIIEKI